MAAAKSPWTQYEGVSYWLNGCSYFYMLINYIRQILPFYISYTIWHTDHISRYPSWFLNGMSFFLASWRLQFHHTEPPMLAWTFCCLSLPAGQYRQSNRSYLPSPPHPTYSAEYTPLIVSTSIVFCMCCQLQIYFQRIVFTNCMLYIMPFCLFLKQCKHIEYPLLCYSWNWEKIHLPTYMRTMAMHVSYFWISDFMPIGLSRLYNYRNGAGKTLGALVEIMHNLEF
jgi:hypothetical protein